MNFTPNFIVVLALLGALLVSLSAFHAGMRQAGTVLLVTGALGWGGELVAAGDWTVAPRAIAALLSLLIIWTLKKHRAGPYKQKADK